VVARATPSAEVQVDSGVLRDLLHVQHPDLAHLPIVALTSGWDNFSFQLGDELLLRLPRRALAAPLIEHEQRWLPLLAPRLPLRVPAPVRVGKPQAAYPWNWSIVPFIPGQTADLEPPQPDQGGTLAGFLNALHHAAPFDAPVNPYRGVPLAQRQAKFDQCRSELAGRTTQLRNEHVELWHAARAAPIDVPMTWIHGDLHPRNILVMQGKLVGVIDWGDVTCGDRAYDLAAIWLLLDDAGSRQTAIKDCAASPHTWSRARGWAVLYSLILLNAGLTDDQRMVAIAERTLHRLLQDS
jgi:aminoglycoside phosphotransferase (APT) family kinase protein